MDAFRETHELMDSLIASYQTGAKDDTHAVREVQRMVEETLAAAGEREQQVQQIIKGAPAGGVAYRCECAPFATAVARRSFACSTDLQDAAPNCMRSTLARGSPPC
jgi:hypothetical protein